MPSKPPHLGSCSTRRSGLAWRKRLLLSSALGVLLLQPAGLAAVHYQQLLTFGTATSDSGWVTSPVLQASDGALYGTASGGGTNGFGYGTVFKLNADGTGYVILHNFSFANGDGSSPAAGLIEGHDGLLYGTTYGYGAYPGGSNDVGTIFKLQKDGSGFAVIHAFATNNVEPHNPFAALIQANDGTLYGTTYYGGANPSAGTLFRLSTNGDDYITLHNFGVAPLDGANCSAALLEANDGALYGTTTAGGTNGAGTVFKLNKDGTGYTILYSFKTDGIDGQTPSEGLVQGSDGALYGATRLGGTNYYSGYGTVFKINTDGSGYQLLHVFNLSSVDGQYPRGRLVEADDGALYGVTSGGGMGNCNGGCGTVFKISKDGSVYARVHDFGTVPGDGVGPLAGLIQGADAALYGTCENGGSGAGSGAIIKLNTDGSGYAVLRRLLGTDAGGYFPETGLSQGSDGDLYGTDVLGGGGFPNGSGTVFRLKSDGSGYTVLYSFGGPGNDGQGPHAGVIEGLDHALYGVTFYGGLSNYGTVFKLQKDGTGYAILHNFGGPSPDGKYPNGTLIQASDGAFYGTTEYGGNGTVYKFNSDGSGFGIVHGFGGTNDGSLPYAGVIEAPDSALYGTTVRGGSNNAGIIFKVTKDGNGYAILHQFTTNNLDGQGPQAPLMEASDGALYGTTYGGGLSNNAGTVFKITKDGTTYAVLHRFGGADGGFPIGGLVEGQDHALYGATSSHLYKINMDGSGYTVVYPTGSWATLLLARNGAFYGTTPDVTAGTVFRLWPPETPDMLGVVMNGGVAQMSLAGASNYQYRVERSTDLTNWQALPLITMPGTGVATNSDNLPPYPAAYYRAAWIP